MVVPRLAYHLQRHENSHGKRADGYPERLTLVAVGYDAILVGLMVL